MVNVPGGSAGWPLKVGAGHEFAVGEAGGVELVGALAELYSHVGDLGFAGGDPVARQLQGTTLRWADSTGQRKNLCELFWLL